MVYANPAFKLTYEDYANIPGDERYELIDGELVMVASPSERHQRVSMNLIRQLLPVEDAGLGSIYHAPFDVILSDTDVVQPDLMFITQERADIITPVNVQGAPDLVVEILSPSAATRDWMQKREVYAYYGVRELWLIEPNSNLVWVLVLRQGEYEIAGIYGEEQTLASPTLGRFEIDLGRVFG